MRPHFLHQLLLWLASLTVLNGQDIKVYLIANRGNRFEYQIINNSEYEAGGLSLGKVDRNYTKPGELLLANVKRVVGPKNWLCDKANDTEDVDCYIYFVKGNGTGVPPHGSMRGFVVFSNSSKKTMSSLTFIVSYWSKTAGKLLDIVGKVE